MQDCLVTVLWIQSDRANLVDNHYEIFTADNTTSIKICSKSSTTIADYSNIKPQTQEQELSSHYPQIPDIE